MKEVIILAKGESRIECPFDGEVWGVNNVGNLPEFQGKKIDKLFTFDPRSPEFLEEMRRYAPVVSWQDYADIKYPLEEIKARFKTRYFPNTIGYMIAYAIYEGYDKIRMYGVDAPFGGMYFLEKSGIEYWCGKAEENGVEVVSTEHSQIMRTKDGLLYGERGHGWLPLYVSERIAILSALPSKGNHGEMFIAGLVQSTIAIKEDEGKEHGIKITRGMDGRTSYQCEKEFMKKLWLPDWIWKYLADVLKKSEREGTLPMTALSIYEKLVEYGNADNFEAKPIKPDVRVSYILTTKNRANFLSHTLENVRKLVTSKDELIIVDGGSTDDTLAVLTQHLSMITKIISEKDNNGTHALNKGILFARGEYIKHLTDDDVIFPQEMERAIKYLDNNPAVDLLVCGGIKQQGKGQVLILAPKNYGHNVKDVFRYGACGVGFIHRRSSFAKLGLLDVVNVDADQEIAVRAISLGLKVEFFPGKHYYHAVYEHSFTVINRKNWHKDNASLMKKYCGVLYYYKGQLAKWLPFLKKWLR